MLTKDQQTNIRYISNNATNDRKNIVAEEVEDNALRGSIFLILTHRPILTIDISFYSVTQPLSELESAERLNRSKFVTFLRDHTLCKKPQISVTNN
jgi:hypothetical protein